MGQSLSRIYIHAVFGTKGRRPLIGEKIEKELHAYIIGILKNLESPSLQINSMPDHIHILFLLSKNYSISEIMQIIKKDSSKWMKSKGYNDFSWQIGYGAFSVSQSQVNKVINYIKNQKEHHKKMSLEKEVDELMTKYKADKYSRDFFWS